MQSHNCKNRVKNFLWSFPYLTVERQLHLSVHAYFCSVFKIIFDRCYTSRSKRVDKRRKKFFSRKRHFHMKNDSEHHHDEKEIYELFLFSQMSFIKSIIIIYIFNILFIHSYFTIDTRRSAETDSRRKRSLLIPFHTLQCHKK